MPDMREFEVWAKTRVHAQRIEHARAILREGASRGPMIVSTSWGKDSVAMCDLAIETLGRVELLHLASPYALPGSEHVVEHFAARATVHTLPATRTLAEYVEWCREIGLPHERDRTAQNRVVTAIKRNHAAAWVEEHGFTVQALGLRIEEGGPRKRVLKARGAVYQNADETWRCNPLAYWSHRDVWAYLVSRGLPWPRLYDCETHGQTRAKIRNTGWLSTDGAHDGRIMWLRAHFPEQFRALVTEFPQVATLA